MSLNKAVYVCLAMAGVAGAQTPPPAPAAPVAPRVRVAVAKVSGKGGYLGVGLRTDGAGVEVSHVSAGSPAEKAGIKTGDNILEVNGRKIDDVAEFIRVIGAMPQGTKVELAVMHEGAKKTLTATLDPRPAMLIAVNSLDQKIQSVQEKLDEASRSLQANHPQMARLQGELDALQNAREQMSTMTLQMPPMPQMPEMPNVRVWSETIPGRGPKMGFEAESLSDQLAEYFGVKAGVLVRTVTAGTPASKAGLKAGDVITKVNGIPVTSTREISGAANAPHKALVFTVMRNRKEITLNLQVASVASPGPERQAL